MTMMVFCPRCGELAKIEVLAPFDLRMTCRCGKPAGYRQIVGDSNVRIKEEPKVCTIKDPLELCDT